MEMGRLRKGERRGFSRRGSAAGENDVAMRGRGWESRRIDKECQSLTSPAITRGHPSHPLLPHSLIVSQTCLITQTKIRNCKLRKLITCQLDTHPLILLFATFLPPSLPPSFTVTTLSEHTGYSHPNHPLLHLHLLSYHLLPNSVTTSYPKLPHLLLVNSKMKLFRQMKNDC